MKQYTIMADLLDESGKLVKQKNISAMAENLEDAKIKFSQGMFEKGEGNEEFQVRFKIEDMKEV